MSLNKFGAFTMEIKSDEADKAFFDGYFEELKASEVKMEIKIEAKAAEYVRYIIGFDELLEVFHAGMILEKYFSQNDRDGLVESRYEFGS